MTITADPKDRSTGFCWDWPKVVQRVMRGTKPDLLKQKHASPVRKSDLPPGWFVIHPEGFDAVYWTFGDAPGFSCNGLRLANPKYLWSHASFSWPEDTQLREPCIAVLDSAANLPLTTQRYELSQETVPFIDELTRDVTLSFIAYALVCGPASRAEAFSLRSRHPLLSKPFSEYRSGWFSREHAFSRGLLRWCTTSAEMVPADAWLYSLLNAGSCVVYGAIVSHSYFIERLAPVECVLNQTATTGYSVLPWHVVIKDFDNDRAHDARRLITMILEQLARDGVVALGHAIEASQVLVSAGSEFDFGAHSIGRLERDDGYRGHKADIWRRIPEPSSPRHWFEATNGTIEPCISLKAVIEAMEKMEVTTIGRGESGLYAAEIWTKRAARTPESPIARLWNECLGARAIPFDAAARKEVIAGASKHPELKRHIEAWKKMKRAGSKWTRLKGIDA